MIVGFLGQSESGKDTASDYLVKKHDFVKIAFADVMKRIAKEVYDFSDNQLWGPQEEKNKQDMRYPVEGKGFLSPRTALQFLGTEVGRGIWEDTWAACTLRAAKKVLAGESSYDKVKGLQPNSFPWLTSKPSGVVISDVRFPNEVKCIHGVGGVVIRLKRAGKDGTIVGGIQGHASESLMKGIPDSDLDGVIDVPEGIDNFHKAILATMMKIPTLVKGLDLR